MRTLRITAGLCILVCLVGCKNIYTTYTPTNPGTPTPPGSPTQPITPKAKFLYTASSEGGLGYVSAFRIDATTGALQQSAGSPISIGASPVILATDADNHFLAMADLTTFRTYLFTLDALGIPKDAVGTVYTLGKTYQPNSLIFNPSGTRLYQANAYTGAMGVFNISQPGAATTMEAVKGSPFAVIPDSPVLANALAFKADGTVLYELDTRQITVLSIASDGIPSVLQTIPVTYGHGLSMDPQGRYLYVADSKNLASYTIDNGNGTLSLAQTTVAATQGIYSFTVSPKGDTAFVSIAGAGATTSDQLQLVSYTIRNGVFTPTATRKGVFALQMAVDPSGAFLYVPQACQTCASPMSKVVEQYTIDSNGVTTPIIGAATASLPAFPLGVALSGSN